MKVTAPKMFIREASFSKQSRYTDGAFNRKEDYTFKNKCLKVLMVWLFEWNSRANYVAWLNNKFFSSLQSQHFVNSKNNLWRHEVNCGSNNSSGANKRIYTRPCICLCTRCTPCTVYVYVFVYSALASTSTHCHLISLQIIPFRNTLCSSSLLTL